MGTVTGRILAVDPQLQQLGKKYRSIISTNENSVLLYVDFSQFEANIMASISGDTETIRRCNAGDLYSTIATELCGHQRHREAAKLMFLAYSYGRSLETLPDLVADIFGTHELAQDALRLQFVPRISGLEQWKVSVISAMFENGRVGTLQGNYRYRTKSGDLTGREKRWAVNQLVQGTGSLILKRLINQISKTLPEIEILLPMHDALLVQIPKSLRYDITASLIAECERVFVSVCPKITPRVVEKSFFS